MQGYDSDFSSSPNRRGLWIVLLVGVALLALLSVGVWRWQAATRAREAALFQNPLGSDSCVNAEDPVACREAQVETRVTNGGDVSLCDQIHDEAGRDSCYWTAARAELKKEACGGIGDAANKLLCEQEVILAQAVHGEDLGACQELQDPTLLAGCETTVRANLVALGRCSDVYDEATCADYQRRDAALLAKDPDQCNAVQSVTMREECLDVIGAGDRDHDGLDATFEASLKTDDRNADTDGDGLSDKEEYDGGTNPLVADTDGDGFSDKDEITNEYDPLTPATR